MLEKLEVTIAYVNLRPPTLFITLLSKTKINFSKLEKFPRLA